MSDIERLRRQGEEMESLTTAIANNGAMLNAARDLVKRQMDEYMRLRQVYIDTRAATAALESVDKGVGAMVAAAARRTGKAN